MKKIIPSMMNTEEFNEITLSYKVDLLIVFLLAVIIVGSTLIGSLNTTKYSETKTHKLEKR